MDDTQAIPKPPRHLDKVGKQKWKEIEPLLERFDESIADLLTMYCRTWSRWKEADAKVTELGTVIKSPSGYPVQNPYLSIANKSLEQLQKVGRRMGLY